MAHEAMDAYLNDHLAGATLGTELAAQIRDRSDGTPLGSVIAAIAREIEEDRQTLVDLMERMDTSRSPVKQAAGWLAEKASRLKFGGPGAGEVDHGLFMALESLTLGVEGKASLWKALKEVAGDHLPLAEIDLDGLIDRATEQHAALERERLSAARHVLGRGD